MSTFIHVTDNHPSGAPLNGEYDYRAGKIQLPSGTLTPVANFEGQAMLIPTSGVFAVASGSDGAWVTFPLST